MGKRGSLSMTEAAIRQHAEKHGLPLPSGLAEKILGAPLQPWQKAILDGPATKPRMNKTETEYARILEAGKRMGEILDYEYEAVSLKWFGMSYKPDFVVQLSPLVTIKELQRLATASAMEFLLPMSDELKGIIVRVVNGGVPAFRIVEVKGAKIWDRDTVRFKGARGRWPLFDFEMHQKTKDGWKRIE